MEVRLFCTKWFNLKRVSILIIIVFTFLFVYFLPRGLVKMTPTIVEVKASNGYADVPELFYSKDIKENNSIFNIGGEWEYYPNMLLTPDDFKSGAAPAARFAVFPHSWSSELDDYPEVEGFATYRVRGIKIGNDDSFGVYSGFQYGAYKIFINGEEMLEVGGVSENRGEYFFSYRSGSAQVSQADEENFEIIIQIQNYDHVMAGFTGFVYAGDLPQIKYFSEFMMTLNGVMLGALLVLLCYFLAVYLKNRSKQVYLNFAIVTLMSIYSTMTTCNESITYNLVPAISPHLIFKLEYIAQLIASFFVTDYIVSRYVTSKTYRKASAFVALGVCLALLIIPSVAVSVIRIQFQILGVAYFILPVYLTTRSMIKKRSITAFWELISLLSIVFAILLSKLGVMIWGSIDIFPILVTVYCFIQVVVMLAHYSEVEQDLKKLNQTLETRIEERTSELIESNKRAEAATAAKSDFLAQMSHEIRTPMNAIIGMSDLITTENLNETQNRYFSDLKEVSRSLLSIVNDILDFSKIESGKFHISPVHYYFQTMIDNLCSLNKYSARAKGLTFEAVIDDDIPDVLYGDETRVRQVVSNILSNAIKYTSRGSIKFTVAKHNEGSEILFSVEDTGVGIRAEDMPRLFKLFERLDSDKNRSEMGTGLGLAICKQMAELMGGYVSVESEYGKGSVFSIAIPLIEGDPAEVEFTGFTQQVYVSGAEILVVDDNSINISVAKGIFATHNIVPDSALSGAEAIELVKKKDYDIIFMDHMMPVMDGVETTAEIRALGGRCAEMPIIALTANAVSGAKEYLMSNGMNDFISKPIDRQSLNILLSRWLPPEKIDRTTDREPEPVRVETEEGEMFLTEVSTVHDLDVMAGLQHAGGDSGTYKTILRQFARETPGYLNQLVQHLNSEDYPAYTVVVHGVKGSLNAIGAKALGYWAYMLEMNSKEGEYDRCNTETDGFIKAVHSLIAKLSPSIAGGGAEISPDARDIDNDELFEILSRMKLACTLGECSVIDETALELSSVKPSGGRAEKVAEIISLSELMEYEEIIELIEILESEGKGIESQSF